MGVQIIGIDITDAKHAEFSGRKIFRLGCKSPPARFLWSNLKKSK